LAITDVNTLQLDMRALRIIDDAVLLRVGEIDHADATDKNYKSFHRFVHFVLGARV
jgi:hypothetical protein